MTAATSRRISLAAAAPAPGTLLVLVLGLGGVMCLAGSRQPLSPGAHTDVLTACGIVLLLLALAAYVGRRSENVRWALLLLAVLVNTVLLATSVSLAGVVHASITFVYAALCAAFDFGRWRLNAVLGLIVVASFVGWVLATPPLHLLEWVTTIGAVVLAGSLLGYVVRELRRSAGTDGLTGVLTRRAFEVAASAALGGDRRREVPTSLVLIDLDNFKEVNDNLGHAAGDGVLVDTVRAWEARLRRGDLVGRLGGDEFVVLLPGTGSKGADRVVAGLHAVSPISFSSGRVVSSPDEPEATVADLVASADAEMYRVKRARRGGSAPRRADGPGPGPAVTPRAYARPPGPPAGP